MNSKQNSTTPHQQYHGQRAEFDNVLKSLHSAKTEDTPLANVLLLPHPHSPLALKQNIGQNAIRKLLRHPAYPQGEALNALSVSITAAGSVYKSTDKNGKEATLSLGDSPSLRELTGKIEKTAQDLGGNLRSDKLLSLAQFLNYYGILDLHTSKTESVETLIMKLEERRARHSLQLFSGLDIASIKRQPNAVDKKILRLLKRRNSTLSISMDELIEHRTRRKIINIVRKFLPKEQSSVLEHLIDKTIPGTTEEQIRTAPFRTIERLLQSTESERLSALLLQGLGWFGETKEQKASPVARTKLIGEAICLWATRRQCTGDVAGFSWQCPSHWGKSYPQIGSEFEQHLLTSCQVSSMREAILLARLLQPRCPLEFQIADIPADLSYRSSITWVNFVHGVHLASAINPGLLERLTFQKLVDFPAVKFMKSSSKYQKLITATRLKPMMDWAVTNGFVEHRPEDDYSPQELETAANKLDFAMDTLKYAVAMVNLTPPQRLKIAKLKLERAFGQGAFITNGLKVTKSDISTSLPNRLGLYDDILKAKTYAFVDVYAAGKLTEQKWFLVDANNAHTPAWIRLDEHGKIQSNLITDAPSLLKNAHLPDIEKTFDSHFKIYVELTKSAYRKLLAMQFASLPLADRLILETASISLYSLRKQTSGIEADDERSTDTLPLRARKGFILQAKHKGETHYYEVLAMAGVIRRRQDIDHRHLNGQRKTERWKVSKSSSVSVAVLRHKTLPFDWDAHAKGTPPDARAECRAILDLVGSVPENPSHPKAPERIPQTLHSQTIKDIIHFISRQFLFFDETQLRESCYGLTAFDEKNRFIEFAKAFVPFWGSIEDLQSDDHRRWIHGVFGAFSDLISFALPVGKLAAGSLRAVNTITHVSFNKVFPAFAKLTASFLNASMNPLDGIGSLLKASGSRGLKLARFGTFKLREIAGRAGRYHIAKGLPQIEDPGRWRPLAKNNHLVSLRGIDDIPMRNTSTLGAPRYHLLDPLTSLPYGPAFYHNSVSFTEGRSALTTLLSTDTHVLVELPKTSHVHQLLEVNGSTTLLVDNTPYRLNGDYLRRADLIDDAPPFTALPCRVKRSPGAETCSTRYVTANPAPAPDVGSVDMSEGFATWFGDTVYRPAIARNPMKLASLDAVEQFRAVTLFQKGIYARIKTHIPTDIPNLKDQFEIAAIIVPSKDESRRYLFTRLNAGDFYMAEVSATEKIFPSRTLHKASTFPADLVTELKTVYAGSLNANNTARIHGTEEVERALKTMEEIAIPIGSHINPPDTLKWLKVTTTPGQALMFDHSTRMTVKQRLIGAQTWTRSRHASDGFRQRAAEIFDTLFEEKTIDLQPNSDLKIDRTMQKLQNLLPAGLKTGNARNIAYADVVTSSGRREVYVSVSGAQGLTGELPLFKSNFPANRIEINGVTYINADAGQTLPKTSLNLTGDSKILAIPRTSHQINEVSALAKRPTSLDSEAKLIGLLREKYPEKNMLTSIDVATTMPPCNSCAVVLKEFGHDGSAETLKVLWG